MDHSSKSKIFMISDLHLSADRSDITDSFLAFLGQEAPQADALYILGDLFEAWIGDDDDCELNLQVANALRELSQSGTRIYFIAGNRDFLLGSQYADNCGMDVLPEVCVHKIFGVPTLLMHGDTLCTLDVDYQRFRAKRNHWWWRTWRLKLPLWLRRKFAERYRNQSNDAKRDKQLDIMDVTPDEVLRVMAHYQCPRLIHGHTHRPAVHELGNRQQRIVLGDWFTQGSILEITPQGVDLQSRPLADKSPAYSAPAANN